MTRALGKFAVELTGKTPSHADGTANFALSSLTDTGYTAVFYDNALDEHGRLTRRPTEKDRGSFWLPSNGKPPFMVRLKQGMPFTKGRYYKGVLNYAVSSCQAQYHPHVALRVESSDGRIGKTTRSVDLCSLTAIKEMRPMDVMTEQEITDYKVSRTLQAKLGRAEIGFHTRDMPEGTYHFGVLNHTLTVAGNDSAFDDIYVYDTTPSIKKTMSPALIPVGGQAVVTLTITNTADMESKEGISVIDMLASGMKIVPENPIESSSTCRNIAVTTTGTPDAALGETTISESSPRLTADLAQGMKSCTIAFKVHITTTGDHTNGVDNLVTPLEKEKHESSNVRAFAPTDEPEVDRTEYATPKTIDPFVNFQPSEHLPDELKTHIPDDPHFTFVTKEGRHLGNTFDVPGKGTFVYDPQKKKIIFTPAEGYVTMEDGGAVAPYMYEDSMGAELRSTATVTVGKLPLIGVENQSSGKQDETQESKSLNPVNLRPGQKLDPKKSGFKQADGSFALTVPAKRQDKEIGTYLFDPVRGKVTFIPHYDFTGTPEPARVVFTDMFATEATSIYTPTVIGTQEKPAGESVAEEQRKANEKATHTTKERAHSHTYLAQTGTGILFYQVSTIALLICGGGLVFFTQCRGKTAQ
ncbi:DUF7933 domain-containing protein [Schaalia sp. lx-260]|uniref:DUF7933 domain-containing protein n=1 Tax=Schaalia sp. lx-260 TaxID=2899082 RepID=UPI001E505776|nr:hypothetical protein [Schaalia sp. lx-260]MCD4550222.1 hypothetical protein [Schaalia sp. lx-260]